MELEEFPLLHFADLVAALLRASSGQPATVEDATRRLGADLEAAHERPPVGPAEVSDHLRRALRHIAAARLVELLDEERFRITPRGRAMLSEHAGGIDDTVLMRFPEFRDWLGRLSDHPPPEDARGREYQRGFAAFIEGADLTDNPYRPDTAQHLAWESGWYEGRDDAFRRGSA